MADFPDTIYVPREKENKSGVVYDPTKKTVLYSEDISKLDAEVVSIETIFAETIKILKGQQISAHIAYNGYDRPFWVSDNGDIYVAGLVANKKNKSCIAVYKSTNGGLTFSQVGETINPLTTAQLEFVNSDSLRLRANSDGEICVVFLGHSEAIPTVWNLMSSFWNGNSWTVESITAEATSGYDAIFPNVDVDGNGDFHACCIQKTAGFTSYATVRYSKRSGGSWSAPVSPLSSTSRTVDQLYLCIDSNNRPVISERGGSASVIDVIRHDGVNWVIQGYTTNPLLYVMAIGPDDSVYLGASTSILKCTSAGAWSILTFTSSGGAYQLSADANYLYAIISAIGNAGSSSNFNGVVQRYRFSDGLIEYSDPLHNYTNNSIVDITQFLNRNKNLHGVVILQRRFPLCFFTTTPSF